VAFWATGEIDDFETTAEAARMSRSDVARGDVLPCDRQTLVGGPRELAGHHSSRRSGAQEVRATTWSPTLPWAGTDGGLAASAKAAAATTHIAQCSSECECSAGGGAGAVDSLA
jgi:hypothetical protein